MELMCYVLVFVVMESWPNLKTVTMQFQAVFAVQHIACSYPMELFAEIPLQDVILLVIVMEQMPFAQLTLQEFAQLALEIAAIMEFAITTDVYVTQDTVEQLAIL